MIKNLTLSFVAMCLSVTVAAANEKVMARYDIEVGGARIMKASYEVILSTKNYRSALNVKSAGMSKWLSEIKLDLTTKGNLLDTSFEPNVYNYVRKKNDKTRKRAVKFNPDGTVKTEGTKYKDNLKTALQKPTLDPLTMLLRLGRATEPCSGQHRAFDGRDVFDIKLSKAGDQNGRIVCTVVYTPVAGGDVEDGDTDSKNYEMTLAPLGGSNGYIPILITGSMKGVPLSIEAKSVEVNGKPLSN
jgi:hypothetical protein